MKNYLAYLVLLYTWVSTAQEVTISGTVKNIQDNKPVKEALVSLKNHRKNSLTDEKGRFIFRTTLKGNHILTINAIDYRTKYFPINISERLIIDLGEIYLKKTQSSLFNNFSIINLESTDFDDSDDQQQIVLESTKDPFIQSAAFNWRSAFFSIRGLDSKYQSTQINGIEVNQLSNNRSNWNSWSGLNDIYKSNEVSNYYEPNTNSFGNLSGVNNLKINTGSFGAGRKASIAQSNRSFGTRMMYTQHSKISEKRWKNSFNIGFRNTPETAIEGASLRSWSLYASIEKQFSPRHNLSLSGIYTPTEKGRVSPITQEVIDLKGTTYNAYWGYQEGKIRNARMRWTATPIIVISDNLQYKGWNINTNMLLKTGTVKNSRIDHTGTNIVSTNDGTYSYEGIGTNPDPTYYQKLPSYFIRNTGNEDYTSAFLADRYFKLDGQIDWERLYQINSTTPNATYIVYKDVTNDKLLAYNSIFQKELNSKWKLQGKLAFKKLISDNYAELDDLLGGSQFLDINAYNEGLEQQSDLRNSNRLVTEGERFKYNCRINVNYPHLFLQTQRTQGKWFLNMGSFIENKTYQREGFYENGVYPGSASFGKSDKVSLFGYGLKCNTTYQINPKSQLKNNLILQRKTPEIQYIFTTQRYSNQIDYNIVPETNIGTDISYQYKYAGHQIRINGYYQQHLNERKRSFFFTEDLASLGRVNNANFYQQLLSNINTQYYGIELGDNLEVTTSLNIQLSGSIGRHHYLNNPYLRVLSEGDTTPVFEGNSYLKNHLLSNGPQQAFGIGFSYRDPKYWWVTSQINHLSKRFISINPYTRTNNFSLDIDGIRFTNYDEAIAEELLKQEELPGIILWNIIGGKSWRIKKHYMGITLGIQNILNTRYQTGGFEQSRNSNYQSMLTDQQRETPLFGNKYWNGIGTTYYINTYLRF